MNNNAYRQIVRLLAVGVMIPLAIFAWWAIDPPSRYNHDLNATYERLSEKVDIKPLAEESEGIKWTKEIR